MKPRNLVWALPALVVTLIVACSGNPSTPTAPVPSDDPSAPAAPPATPAAPAPAASGTLSVRITDGPFTDAKALLITFSEVSAHTSEGGWSALEFADNETTRTCDLKRLLDAEDVLGTGPLAEGRYTQLRLTVSSAEIYFDRATTGTSACAPTMTLEAGPEVGTPVDVPSGTVKLNHPFDVVGSAATTILLDFDGDKSVHETGNGKYKLQPVIRVVSVQ